MEGSSSVASRRSFLGSLVAAPVVSAAVGQGSSDNITTSESPHVFTPPPGTGPA